MKHERVTIPDGDYLSLVDGLKAKDQRINELERQLTEAQKEVQDHRHLFDLQWKRMGEATKLWREHNPGNDLVSPDLGNLLTWLLAQISEAKDEIAQHDLWREEAYKNLAGEVWEREQVYGAALDLIAASEWPTPVKEYAAGVRKHPAGTVYERCKNCGLVKAQPPTS